MTVKSIYCWVALLACVVLTAACTDSDRDKDVETVGAQDNALAEHFFQDIFRQIHTVAMRDTLISDTGTFQLPNACLDTLFKTDSIGIFPVTVFIGYGGDDIACSDSRMRKGNIVATFSGNYLDQGTTINVNLDAYQVDDIFVDAASLVIRNTGTNMEGKRIYNVRVTDAELMGRSIDIEWSSNKNMTWVEGGDSTDMNIGDDVFMVRGTADGRNSRGNIFTAEIEQALRRPFNCNWVVSGTEVLVIPNLADRTVNYGEGVCDDQVTATRDRTNLSFTLQ